MYLKLVKKREILTFECGGCAGYIPKFLTKLHFVKRTEAILFKSVYNCYK